MSIGASVVLGSVLSVTGTINLLPGISADGLDRANGTSSIVTIMHLGLLLQHARNAKEAKRASTQITGQITGLAPGQYTLHVNQLGDLTNGCILAGPPSNPFDKTRGGPKDEGQQVGDLGTVEAGADGIANVNIANSLVEVAGLIGRTLVVRPVDLGQSAPVACGVIVPAL